MAVSSPQKTPTSPHVRARVAACAALVCTAALICAAVLGLLAYPLVLALASAWCLRANEAHNGRN